MLLFVYFCVIIQSDIMSVYHLVIMGNNIMIGGDFMLNKNGLKAKIVKNDKLNVVHDNDLEHLLKSLDVYNGVVGGSFNCLFCGGIITMENIDSIVPHNGTVQFTCDGLECHAKLIGMR